MLFLIERYALCAMRYAEERFALLTLQYKDYFQRYSELNDLPVFHPGALLLNADARYASQRLRRPLEAHHDRILKALRRTRNDLCHTCNSAFRPHKPPSLIICDVH